MQIVQTLAGYSLGRADIIRRAMGKKKIKVMEEEKHYFINGKFDKNGNVEVPGCVGNGISKNIAEKIWEQMAHFSSYAFNKSHGAVYAMLAAYTAWLKKYYPSIFMAETMNIFNSDTDKLNMYLHVTSEMGIKILPPNLNKSNKEFSSNRQDIFFGLGAIKFMGQNSDFIIEEREKRGPFASYQDFVVRMVKYQQTNKRAFEGLIYSGALDTFEGTRRAKIEFLPLLLEERKKEVNKNIGGQIFMGEYKNELASQFENIDILPQKEEYIKKFKLEKEKEYAGFYVTEHPLDDYMKYFKNKNIAKIGEIINSGSEDEEGECFNPEYYDGVSIKVAGIICDKKTYYTKKGDPLFAFEIEGKTGTIKSVMFNNQIELMGEKVIEGNVVIIEGTLKIDNFGFQIIANNVVDITRLKDNNKNKVVKITAINKEQLDKFNQDIIKNNNSLGNVPVYVSFQGQNLKSSQDIDLNIGVISKLDNIFADNYEVIQR